MERYREIGPKIHCLTNPVVMQDTANLLLAAGGSAIMAQDPAEVEEITAFCQATLLNIGVPDEAKFKACILAGKRANTLGHPVILDPVGAGASRFRREGLQRLFSHITFDLIRCNQEEACVLLYMRRKISAGNPSLGKPPAKAKGGVESQEAFREEELKELAAQLGRACSCTVLISGEKDAVSDGTHTVLIPGGTKRMRRLTGGGCMLSALCALFCGFGCPPYEAAQKASRLWKESAGRSEERILRTGGGMGSFHSYLFDAVEELCCGGCGKETG